jgi:hypothetical protein
LPTFRGRVFAGRDDFSPPANHGAANQTAEVKRMLMALIQKLKADR